jgi:hypothetical protein
MQMLPKENGLFLEIADVSTGWVSLFSRVVWKFKTTKFGLAL